MFLKVDRAKLEVTGEFEGAGLETYPWNQFPSGNSFFYGSNQNNGIGKCMYLK